MALGNGPGLRSADQLRLALHPQAWRCLWMRLHRPLLEFGRRRFNNQYKRSALELLSPVRDQLDTLLAPCAAAPWATSLRQQLTVALRNLTRGVSDDGPTPTS